ncbi:hypothetical protein ACGFIE_31255 [Micromonospora sp. NPDC049275]|uniref:DUF7161 family protein n=1 Tax=Micromonospora sp. NPDC049275 TaxID=3364268 RepID=UPI003719053D
MTGPSAADDRTASEHHRRLPVEQPATPTSTAWRPVRASETGLNGRAARLLTSDPTDDAGWPADLPAGTTEVVIVEETVSPTATLKVRTNGDAAPKTARVRFDQLAVRDESARG